ncbi:MAG: EthD family reductase [Alphaproteobacteria bacterium]|nr:EthD family reductase [Alphaproteobacteria bacterium]
MTVSYFIRYVGTPEDADAFFDHYRRRHVAFLKDYPGIRGCRLHRPIPWNDPVAVVKDQVLVLAELMFDDAAALDRALHSEARQRSRGDFLNFPRLRDGEIRHLAVETETLF